MNFYKAAAALVLVAMTLTSCKSPESDTSESAPPAEETISMATACKEALPLVSDTMLLSVKIKMNTAKGASSDDDIVRNNSNLDGLDGIAESIETEEGRASLLELTKGMDELLEATINGENTDAILDALEKKGYAFDEQCK